MIDWVLSDTELSVAHFRLKTAMMMRCKRAIKANHHLDNHQARRCWKGWPVSKIRLIIHGLDCDSHDTDLEKLFKRIQDHHQAYSRDFDAHSF